MKIRQPSKHLKNHHEVMEDIYKLTRGNITYGTGPVNDINSNDQTQNISGAWATVTSPVAPNTNFAVTHNLGKIPTGYHILKKSISADIYDGSTAWTETQIFLKANAASVTITVFVLG